MLKKISGLLKNQTVSNGAVFAFFSFLNSGIGFILTLILAKFIDPDGYGELNLFNNVITLLSYFICLSTSTYFSVSYFKKSHDYMVGVVNTVFFVLIVMASFFFLVLGVGGVSISALVGVNVHFLSYAIIICVCTVVFNLQMEILRLQEKPFIYGFYSLLNVLSNFILTILLVVVVKQGWHGRAYSHLVVSVILFFVALIFLKRNDYLHVKLPDKVIMKEALLYALPLIPHLFSGWLRGGFDRYVINYYYDAASVGCYSFASNFAMIVSIAGNAFNATNSVFIFKKLAGGYDANCKKTFRKQNSLMILLFGVLSIAVIIGVSIGIPLFFPKYNGSVAFIVPTTLGSFFWCIYLLYVNFLFFYKKTLSLMYVTISMSLLQAGISLIITRYSILATAYLSMTISLITTIIIYILHKRTLHKEENRII